MQDSIIYRILFFAFFIKSAACSHVDHMLLMWEHKDFHGKSGYILLRNHECKPLIVDWRNKVSSVNTFRHCYQLFAGESCNGKSIFVYPMSKYHNDLSQLDMNDNVKSIRLCVLDEKSFDTSAKPLSTNGPEYFFWSYIFDKLSKVYLEEFKNRTLETNFINWDFLPNISKNTSSAEQYQCALDWLLDEISDRDKFRLAQLRTMRKMAYSVFDYRANQNAARKPQPPLGSQIDAVFFQLEVYWKMVVEAIDNKMEKIEFGSEEEIRKPIPKKKKHW